MPQFNVSSEINVEAIRPDTGNFYKLTVTAADLIDLAERFGWVSVDALAAELRVRKVARDCWDIHGHMTAQICQNCVVTGEAVSESIDFQIEERYVRNAEQGEDVEVGLDGVEPLKNGAIDIGELVVQSLGLAATPWPRVDDAPDSYVIGDQALDHPFAGLSVLKQQTRK